jgi:hypothetical protein
MTVWLKARPHSGRIEHSILERPLLHACCGDDRDFFFGDIRMDIDPGTHPTVLGDITALPFRDDAFGAVFADVPWVERWRWQLGKAIKESLRVAPICYIMGPWLYGAAVAPIDWVQVCYQPGIHHPVLFARYLGNRDMTRGAR